MIKREVCEEIGFWYGEFFTEDIYLCINNGQHVFKYETEDALLIDWLDTLIEEDKATGRPTWADVIEFIKNEVVNQ